MFLQSRFHLDIHCHWARWKGGAVRMYNKHMSYQLAFPGFNIIRYFRNREMTELYLAIFIKNLAHSLVLLFIPIFLYSLNFSIRAIAFFYVFEFLGVVLATPLGLWLNYKLGVKKTMFLGDVLFIAYLFSLTTLKAFGAPAALPILLFAFSGGLFWAAYQVDFTRSADRRAEGQNLSVVKSIILVASALGPFIGSMVIVNASFATSFMVAAALSLLACVPLFLSADFKEKKPNFSWGRLRRADKPDKAISYVGYGAIQLATETFWPLYMYVLLQSVLEVGTVFTLTTIVMVIFILWFGRRVDRKPVESLVAGVVLHAPSWILRLLLVTPFGFFFSSLYGQLSYHLLDTAYEKVVYTEAEESTDRSNYFFFRQLWIGVGRLVACLTVLVTGSLDTVFLLAFIMTFCYLLLLPRLLAWGPQKRRAHM